MSGHTPGPWKWFDYPDGRKLLCAQNRAVIHCPDASITCDSDDARLIAAAPDLLAALKAMMDGAYGNPSFPDENALVEEEAAKAIAKAEGK